MRYIPYSLLFGGNISSYFIERGITLYFGSLGANINYEVPRPYDKPFKHSYLFMSPPPHLNILNYIQTDIFRQLM